MASEGDVTKLPKWAQEHIRDLERQREAAVTALNRALDAQTPGPFYYDDNVLIGDRQGPSRKRIYFAQHEWSICCEHAGLILRVTARRDREEVIGLQWGLVDWSTKDVAMVPVSHNAVRLVAQENMR